MNIKLSTKYHMKRLQYELFNNILPLGYEVSLLLTNKTDINVVLNIKNHKVLIHIKEFFPFKAPYIYINGHPYIDILRTNFSNILKNLNGMECLCCNSCIYEWGPTINLIHLLNEINFIIDTKERIMERYYAKKIQKIYIKDEFFNCIENFL